MEHDSEAKTQQIASAYALGALNALESEAFRQHLASRCKVCSKEVRSFDEILSLLGFSAAGIEPSPKVREKLMSRIREEKMIVGSGFDSLERV